MYQWLLHHENKIGGNGIIVEIGETKFGHRKYNHGRLLTMAF